MEFQEGNSERLSLLCEGGDEGQLKVQSIWETKEKREKKETTNKETGGGVGAIFVYFTRQQLFVVVSMLLLRKWILTSR